MVNTYIPSLRKVDFSHPTGHYTGWSISSAKNFNGKVISDESKYFTFQAHHRKEETFLHQIHVTEGHLKDVARQ